MGNPISDLIFGAREGMQQSFKGLLATLGFGILIGLILIGVGFLISGIWALALILFGIIVIIGSIRRFIVGTVVKGGATIKSKMFGNDKQSLKEESLHTIFYNVHCSSCNSDYETKLYLNSNELESGHVRRICANCGQPLEFDIQRAYQQPPTVEQSAIQVLQQPQQPPQQQGMQQIPRQSQTIQVKCMHCGQINTVIPGQESFVCIKCGVKSVKK